MRDRDLLEQLDIFEVRDDPELRAARRPAGADLVVEFEALPNRSKEGGLAGFWLDALWRFLEDNRRSTEAFEGMAFQALAERLDALEFERLYGRVRERLTLRPPQGIELLEAYRVLNGRVSSFAGVTTDGEFWTGFYQADVFELHPG
ncbi:MAG: hypothetical protein KC910_31445 [Candidatus Eremiobacteraeota bacterium]|nr:hypothetical protein [Candidatus Eremiobacteraeota bacterium]